MTIRVASESEPQEIWRTGHGAKSRTCKLCKSLSRAPIEVGSDSEPPEICYANHGAKSRLCRVGKRPNRVPIRVKIGLSKIR